MYDILFRFFERMVAIYSNRNLSNPGLHDPWNALGDAIRDTTDELDKFAQKEAMFYDPKYTGYEPKSGNTSSQQNNRF